MLHTGELSVQSGLRLMHKVPAEDQPKVIELAQQYQEEDRLTKPLISARRAQVAGGSRHPPPAEPSALRPLPWPALSAT
jgi:hypothetical protein